MFPHVFYRSRRRDTLGHPNASSKDAVRWLRPEKLAKTISFDVNLFVSFKAREKNDSYFSENTIQSEIIGKMNSRFYMYIAFLFFGILENSSKIWDQVQVDPPHVLPFRREESGGFCSEAEPCGRGGILPSSMGQKGSQCLLKT